MKLHEIRSNERLFHCIRWSGFSSTELDAGQPRLTLSIGTDDRGWKPLPQLRITKIWWNWAKVISPPKSLFSDQTCY
jgi:hypothetical protein